MTTLRITAIPDDRPVRMTVQIPADLHRELVTYAALVATDGKDIPPAKLIVPMLRHFLASDHVFLKQKRAGLRRSIL